MLPDGVTGFRHPATRNLTRWFTYQHLPASPARDVSVSCAHLAATMVEQLPDGPELSAGLRHLLEAKDCFVRAAIDMADVAAAMGSGGEVPAGGAPVP